MSSLRSILILIPAFALVGAAIWFFTRGGTATNATGEPGTGDGKLVVLVVFDQMRGEYLREWAPHFGNDGFERIKRDGTWYANATLPYAATATASGHASIVSGTTPSVHGIVENAWFDRGRGRVVYASSAEEVYPRVPASRDSGLGMAPTRMLAPTLTDSLKSSGGRVFSLSLKDRAAVLMGGKDPAGVYCFDSATGEFHTSTFYRERLPAWVEQFNKSDTPNRWGGKVWDRVSATVNYDQVAGPDDQPGEYGQPRTMPKPLPPADAGGLYYAALERTPFGNELLWEFAKSCIAAEKLGNAGHRDLLCLSFSSNDLIGHTYGPNSHEVLDATLRSDALLSAVIHHLETTLGKDRYSLVVTSDHGIAPLPEVAVKAHPEAARVHYQDLVNGMEAAIDDTFGKPNGAPGAWVEANFKDTRPWVFLNRRLIESTGIPYETIENYARNWLANRPDALDAFSRTQLMKGTNDTAKNPHYEMIKAAFHADRCGDIYIVQKPYQQLTGRTGLGVDHGTLHDYDRDVFVMAFGTGVPKLGRMAENCNALIVAPIIAKLLGVPPPEKAIEKLPTGW